MKKKQFLLFLLAALVLFTTQSCVKHRDMVTLNRLDNKAGFHDGQPLYISEVYPYRPHRIRPHDQLMVKINAFDGSTEEFLNREFRTENTYSRDINFDPPSLYFNTYTVDEFGFLYLPVIDSVYVKGMTVNELKRSLDISYKPHLTYASTTVKLANWRVTVIGEVNEPGVQYLYNDKATILDAIGQSGGITEFGNRNNVKVIRTLRNGNTESVYLDLTTYQFVATEYYFVQPDDIIYVEPVKAKSFDASSRAIGVVFSAISTLALIINLVWR